MTRTYRKANGKPDDRAWLYDQVYDYIITSTAYEVRHRVKFRARGDQLIYENFADYSSVDPNRPSWLKKNRKIKRDMITSVLRRLVEDGKISIYAEEPIDSKSMHGGARRNLNHRIHAMGKEHKSLKRWYIKTNALQAIADALGD